MSIFKFLIAITAGAAVGNHNKRFKKKHYKRSGYRDNQAKNNPAKYRR